MSWLKDKLFGPKPRLGSCSHFESYESQESSSALYCQLQLKNFIDCGQELKTYIMGYDIVSDVRGKSNQEKYVIYKVAVCALGENYVIDRRYKEFLDLHEQASKMYPEYDFSNFPSRRL